MPKGMMMMGGGGGPQQWIHVNNVELDSDYSDAGPLSVWTNLAGADDAVAEFVGEEPIVVQPGQNGLSTVRFGDTGNTVMRVVDIMPLGAPITDGFTFFFAFKPYTVGGFKLFMGSANEIDPFAYDLVNISAGFDSRMASIWGDGISGSGIYSGGNAVDPNDLGYDTLFANQFVIGAMRYEPTVSPTDISVWLRGYNSLLTWQAFATAQTSLNSVVGDVILGGIMISGGFPAYVFDGELGELELWEGALSDTLIQQTLSTYQNTWFGPAVGSKLDYLTVVEDVYETQVKELP